MDDGGYIEMMDIITVGRAGHQWSSPYAWVKCVQPCCKALVTIMMVMSPLIYYLRIDHKNNTRMRWPHGGTTTIDEYEQDMSDRGGNSMDHYV